MVLKVFLTLFCIYFIWDKLTESYLNPYKLIMVFGKKGSGKTTFLTKQAIKHMKKGWKVYSNIEIPGTILMDKDDSMAYYHIPPNSLILVDEVGMIWDNRKYANFKDEVRDYFKLQRHYKHKVILCSQAFDIDKKLRDLTDEMYLLTNFLRVWSMLRKINKKIDISNGLNNDGNTNNNGGALVEIYKFTGLPSFTFIPRWSIFFNSFEVKILSLINQFKEIRFNKGTEQYLNGKTYYKHALQSLLFNIYFEFYRFIANNQIKRITKSLQPLKKRKKWNIFKFFKR